MEFSWKDNVPADIQQSREKAGKNPPLWYVGPVLGIATVELELIKPPQELIDELGLSTRPLGDYQRPKKPEPTKD
jgi:hypothetical protein